MMTETSPAPTRKIVPTLLVFAGMTPFIVSTLFVLHFDRLMAVHGNLGAASDMIALRLQFALLSLLAYGAVILSFLGGLRWGVELNNAPHGPNGLVLSLSVLGSLAGWGFVLWGAMVKTSIELFFCYAIVFLLHMIWDISTPVLPRWFKRLRVAASLVAAGSYAVAAVLLYLL